MQKPLSALALITAASVSTGATTPTSTACQTAEHRQFDFWLGDWDVFDYGDTKQVIARATVTKIVEGCAIHELYVQNDGLIGDSILSFDAVRRVWQQTWVTNRGALMVIAGPFEGGAVTLEGDTHLRDGSSVRQRITWQKEGSDVRESALISKDDGKTWTPAFDVVFRRRQ
jgi:hypothetical protein